MQELDRFLVLSKFPDDASLSEELKRRGLGLKPNEVRMIAGFLGRDPRQTELKIFDIEWSEHCSYKSSKAILKRYLHTDGPNVVLGPGEDSGIVRFATINGVSYCIVISHESHNHPSQVLPVEGAATGIGGDVRDVDCMGAHVIAVADQLRFGDPYGKHKERVKWIANGVVEGIWTYGNALGVPNICGDVFFDSCYDDNCLVNVVAIGIVKEHEIIRSRVPEEGVGYDIIIVGKPTDNSGFGGVTFASEILDEKKEEESKGAVQIPDPFLKNVLAMRKANAEVWRRAFEKGYKIGMKDLGGGGLACATGEICANGGYGAEIELDRLHVSMENLLPEVLACAETQERYVLVVPPEFTPEVLKIYNEEWDLPNIYKGARASVVGKVIKEPRYILKYKGRVVCDIPIHKLCGGISYNRKAIPRKIRYREPKFPMPDLNKIMLKLMASPNIASREAIFRYYDTEVQGNTVIRPGEADAGLVVPIEGEKYGIALSADGNPRYGAISPYWCGANAVAESMRNVAAIGAVPWAITDCLNFGNPEKPHAFWDFEEAVRGLSDAAKHIRLKGYGVPVPIISGNVSFYNESARGKAILPSPSVACIGIMQDFTKAITMGLKQEGNRLVLLGERKDELGGSEYYALFKRMGANVPKIIFEKEEAMIHTVIDAIESSFVLSAHDISNGGLAATIVEMVIAGRKGACISINGLGEMRADKILFSESSGFVLEVKPENVHRVLKLFEERGLYAREIGEVKGKNFTVDSLISIGIEELEEAWRKGLADAMG